MIIDENEVAEKINNKNIKIFNENGGIEMYIYKISDKDESTSKDKILEKIKGVDDKYSAKEYVPKEVQTLGLEEMTFEAPTEQEIERRAIESLEDYKDNNLENINSKYDLKFSGLSEDAQKALEDKEEDSEKVSSSYEEDFEKVKNKNIKQGVARSSIYQNALKEIEENKSTQQREIEQSYNKSVAKLENERSILEQQKESALTSFDISYAVKLQSKIAGLNSEIAKEQAKILKYNQEIAKQEEAYKKEQEKSAEAEKREVEKKNKELERLGTTEVAKLKAQEKYEILYGYLSNLSKEEALSELASDLIYKKQLGSYYNLLYAQMLKRKA